MKNHKIALTLFAFVTSTLAFSCSKSSTNDLQEAQLCLNKAAASEAMNCVSSIASDTSALAYSLRCSAIFISEGFGDAVDFVDALDNINGGSGTCTGGCSSTVGALYSLKFASGDLTDPAVRTANNEKAALAFSQCSQADAKIYTQIASIFRLGTMTSMLAYSTSGGGPIDEDDLKTALQSGSLSASDVGAIVSVTYGTSCQNTEDASESTQAYCEQLDLAFQDGLTEAQIGQCLIDNLIDPTDTTCP